MSRKENDDFIATKEEKSFDDDGNTVVATGPKVIELGPKILLKKLQDSGGNIRKSSLAKKKISDVLSKKDWKKNKMKD